MDAMDYIRGVATGGISVYIPQKSAFVSSLLAVLFTCGTLTCFDFEIGMTRVVYYVHRPIIHYWLVKIYTTQMKFLATPLDYISTNYGCNSTSRSPFITRTQTDTPKSQIDTTDHPTRSVYFGFQNDFVMCDLYDTKLTDDLPTDWLSYSFI